MVCAYDAGEAFSARSAEKRRNTGISGICAVCAADVRNPFFRLCDFMRPIIFLRGGGNIMNRIAEVICNDKARKDMKNAMIAKIFNRIADFS